MEICFTDECVEKEKKILKKENERLKAKLTFALLRSTIVRR